MTWRAISARPYDAEVRRRGWAHVKPLNFPQPGELAEYPQTVERCDERGLPLSLAPEPSIAAQELAIAPFSAGHRRHGTQKPGRAAVQVDPRLTPG